jgi:hypothetical protein
MNTRNTVIGLIVLLILAAGLWYVWNHQKPAVASFDECAAHYPVAETYPATCAGPDGTQYTQDIGNELGKTQLITIDSPRPNATVSGPIAIKGKARGNWFFEASFPIELKDAKGNVLGQTHAQAQGDWMTENFVDYTATLTFPPQPKGSKGTLYLKKDNPSGDPARDDALIVPVVF